jgi:hypothetical protein
MIMQPLGFYLLCPLLFLAASTTHAFTEQERVAEYLARNWSWPIPAFQPNTEGWDRLMRRRLRQVEEIEDAGARFEGYAQTLTAALIQPNYTEVSVVASQTIQEDVSLLVYQSLESLILYPYHLSLVWIWHCTGA